MTSSLQHSERQGRETVSTQLVTVGRHVFAPEHPEWSRANALGPSPIMAFSRTPIRAQFELEAPVMLTGAVAATPAAHSRYVRTPRSRTGHDVVWCLFRDPTELARTVASVRPEAADNPLDPFGRPCLPTSPLAGALTRSLARVALDTPELCDPSEIDEAVIRVAEILTESLGQQATLRRRPHATRDNHDAVNRAAEILAIRFVDPPSLTRLAHDTGLSPAYLSRSFRNQTGITISAYISLLRLAEACELLRDRRCSVARAAFASGFASHAHLTSTCRRRTGVTPSAIAEAHRRRLRHMLKLVRERAS